MYRYLLFILCIAGNGSRAQSAKAFLIGDTVPDAVVGRSMNNSAGKVKLYKGRPALVLLDFWSATCGSCLHAMPKLDSLQTKFGSRLRILTITKDNAQMVQRTLARIKIPLPAAGIILADSNFVKHFPYLSVPHHVWLDSNYRIRYITIGSNATEKNIRSFLRGEKLDFVTKYEFEEYDITQPLWLEGNGRLMPYMESYSFIMKYIAGYPGARMGRFTDSAKNSTGFRAYNFPLISMIKAAWEQFPVATFEHNNRVVYEVKDTTPFFPPVDPNDYEEWSASNAYCYELYLPLSKAKELFTFMQQDILRYFNYDIRIEKRKLRCLALVRTSGTDKLKTAGRSFRKYAGRDSIILGNISFAQFVQSLTSFNRHLSQPVIDETGYTGKVDLLLGAFYDQPGQLRKELQRYDLDLIEKDCMIDILIIRDKK